MQTQALDQLSFDFVVPAWKIREEQSLQKKREDTRHLWKICWDWDGPKVGEPLEVGATCVKMLGESELSYWYCAPCIADEEVEPGIWIVTVCYPETAPEHCRAWNGTKLILDVADIWAPVWVLAHRRVCNE